MAYKKPPDSWRVCCALFVLAAVQSRTFTACPLCCWRNFPLNMSVFSPQSFWEFIPTAEDALARSEIVLGHL